jgi:predicted TIM-barrel fold metal-dependent hydrolase
MNKYRLGVWEEISGFIDILAESEDDAREKTQDIIDEYGLERIFYGDSFPSNYLLAHKHTHGMREVLDCEQVQEGFPVGNEADFGDRME